MLYFSINGLETTEEECFTQQQKVFVSVFSISFSLSGYLIMTWVTSGSASELHKLPTFFFNGSVSYGDLRSGRWGKRVR